MNALKIALQLAAILLPAFCSVGILGVDIHQQKVVQQKMQQKEEIKKELDSDNNQLEN